MRPAESKERSAGGADHYSVLILGAGLMQLPAIRIARERGWRVAVADANESAPGAALADAFYRVDLKDKSGMERAARRIAKNGRLDGVITVGTDFSETVAWVAERLGLPGIPYEVARRATDKSLMRAALRTARVPSPDFVVVESVAECAGAVSDAGLRLPLVVKPVDNMGARGVRRVDSLAELEASTDSAIRFSRSRRAIVEEFIAGPEFSIDAIVEHGEVRITGVADRIIGCSPYFVELGHTLPSAAVRRDIDLVCAVFKRAIRALGIESGAAKGDIKLSPKGPVVGEVAARLSGGYMSGWTFPFASGVQVAGAALNVAVGLDAGDLRPTWKQVSAERAFISIPGRVRRISGVEAVLKQPWVKECFLRVSPGATVVFPTNNVEKCGNVITQAATRAHAVSAAEDACRSILIRMEPGDPATEEFLFGRDASHAAFKLVGEPAKQRPRDGNRSKASARASAARALASMPTTLGATTSSRIALLLLEGYRSVVSTDWQGRSLREALDAVTATTDCAVVATANAKAADVFYVGALFWQALIRGSVQGGVWLLETVGRLLDEPSGRTEIDRLTARLEARP